LLEPGGTLIFSNNYRRFRMDPPILEQFVVEDITARTLPRDFARNPRIHNCWLLRTVTPDAQTKAGKPDRAQAGSGTAPESARRCDSEPTLPPRPRC